MLRLLLFLLAASAAAAQLRPWDEYHTILWMSGTMEKHRDQRPLIAQRMRELGDQHRHGPQGRAAEDAS